MQFSAMVQVFRPGPKINSVFRLTPTAMVQVYRPGPKFQSVFGLILLLKSQGIISVVPLNLQFS